MSALFDYFNEAPCGYVVCNFDRTIRRVNRTLLDLVELTETDIVGVMSIGDLFDLGGKIFLESRILPVLMTAGKIDEIACNLVGKAGPGVPCLMHGKLTSSNEFVFSFFAIRERRRFERELQTARRDTQKALERAEDAQRAKALFFASMSHEMRTPLNAIIGFSDIMAMELFGPVGNARYKAYAGDIGKSANHLLSLIDDLLDLSRAESGVDPAGGKPAGERIVDIDDVLEEATRTVQPIAAAAGVEIVRHAAHKHLRAVGERRGLLQILLNLLSNAIKMSPSGKPVLLEIARTAHHASITVRDQGPGFSEFMRAKFGEAYAQDPDNNAAHKGTGLGLAISKRLALSMGGSLSLGDTRKGAALILKLQLAE
jgi:signal transduction histidine kinase